MYDVTKDDRICLITEQKQSWLQEQLERSHEGWYYKKKIEIIKSKEITFHLIKIKTKKIKIPIY